MIAFLVSGIRFGGYAAIQHGVLERILVRNGNIPKNLPSFLDLSVQLIIMRKVGGGYIFTHRILMEYLAQHYSQFTDSPVRTKFDPTDFTRRWWRPLLLVFSGPTLFIASALLLSAHMDSIASLTFSVMGIPVGLIGIQHLRHKRLVHGGLFCILSVGWGLGGLLGVDWPNPVALIALFSTPAYLIWAIVDAVRGKRG